MNPALNSHTRLWLNLTMTKLGHSGAGTEEGGWRGKATEEEFPINVKVLSDYDGLAHTPQICQFNHPVNYSTNKLSCYADIPFENSDKFTFSSALSAETEPQSSPVSRLYTC